MRIRVGLRTDLNQVPGAARLTGAIPVALDGDCLAGGLSLPAAVGPKDPDPGGVFPTFVLRARSGQETDEDGIVHWIWQTIYQGQVVMRDIERVEVSDAAGQVRVRAVLDVTPEQGARPPRETVTAWDEDGRQWNVTSVEDQGAMWVLSIERVDDGS